MQSRLFLLFSFCLKLEFVKGLHHESAFDLELYKSVLNSDLCGKQINFLFSHPHLLQKFRTANANIPHDLSAKGVLTYTGDYSNCLSINEHVNGLQLQGKYSQVTVDVPGHINNYEYKRIDNVTWQEMRRNFYRRQSIKMSVLIGCKAESAPDPKDWETFVNTTTVTLGICIPEPCSATQAIDLVLDTENRPLTLEGKVIEHKYTEVFYRLPSDRPISSADYVFTIFLGLVFLSAITGTVYDIKNVDTFVSTKMTSILRCFAVHKNVRRILKYDSSSDTIQCVDGIRTIAMVMIIWYHSFINLRERLPFLFSGSSDLFQYTMTPFFLYSVDTFFLLGGIFKVYSTVSKYKQRQFVRNVHLHLLNRLVRIYPVFCFAVLAQASILNHVGDGPQWYEMAREVIGCRLNWWSNLLFIQNIIIVCHTGSQYKCLSHTWYLSADMQYFLVSTLVLMWMFGKKRTAWIALGVTLILSLCCSTIFSYLYNFNVPLFNIEYHPETMENSLKHHKNTLCRSPSYFIGMVIGYIVIYLKDRTKMKKVWILYLWILTIFILTLSVSGMSIIWDSIENKVLHHLINGNMKAFWCMGVSWIIIACHLGYGGPVNWFLCLKQWKLLSRLSYAMYIVHYPIMTWMNSVQSDDIVILKTVYLTMFQYFLSAFFASIIIALIVTVLIEQPVLNLYRLLKQGGGKPVSNIKGEIEDKEDTANVNKNFNSKK